LRKRSGGNNNWIDLDTISVLVTGISLNAIVVTGTFIFWASTKQHPSYDKEKDG
jgi:hypothetical protein